MIVLKDLVVSNESGEKFTPISAEFSHGLNYIQKDKKALFDILSFYFSDVLEGEFQIDDVSITKDEKQYGRCFFLELTVTDIASLKVVFLLPSNPKEAREKRTAIADGLSSLKEMPSASLEEKRNKMSSLAVFLHEQQAAYVLIDLAEKTNADNRGTILNAFNEAGILGIVMEKEEVRVAISSSHGPKKQIQKRTPKIDWKRYFKTEYSGFLFLIVFSALASFGSFASTCFLEVDQLAYGIIALVIALICFIANLDAVCSLYEEATKFVEQAEEFLKIQLLGVASTLVGILLATLVAFVGAKQGLFSNEEKNVSTLAYVIGIVVSLVLLLTTFLSKFLFTFREKCLAFFKRRR